MEDVEETRTRVVLKEHGLHNTRATDFPGNYEGYDDAWNFDNLQEKFKIDHINRPDEMSLEFDMVGTDAAIANAFRRIMIAEVPTMAAEKVFVVNNTSVIQDEVLAHRIGLIPFKAHPQLFQYRLPDDEKGSPENTLQFELKIHCPSKKSQSKQPAGQVEYHESFSVYSGSIRWVPIGNQRTTFTEDEVGPVVKDILIAKLRPGQEIHLKMHCVKGIGRDHAKFSPVATASYRLLPEITLIKPVYEDDAVRLASCFSKGVIEIEKRNDVRCAKVGNARMDMCSRNVFCHEDLKDCVKISKVRDHFIFSVESTGAWKPEELFLESVSVLDRKCLSFLDELKSGSKKTP